VTQLVGLQRLLAEQSGLQAQVLAISVDTHTQSLDLLAELAQTPGPAQAAFPLLEDQGHRVIDRYGILNPGSRGWPHPATYVIDRNGMVRWKFVETDYKVRPKNEDIVAALAALN
jgi:peroxiredoxin